MPFKDADKRKEYGEQYYRERYHRLNAIIEKADKIDEIMAALAKTAPNNQRIAIIGVVMAMAMSALSLWVSLAALAQIKAMQGP